jgi:hypothetical protein
VRDKQGNLVILRAPSRPFHTGLDTSEIMHRRELIARHGLWVSSDVEYDTDWEIIGRWLRKGETFALTRKATLNYTMPSTGFMYKYAHYKHKIATGIWAFFTGTLRHPLDRTPRS